MTQYINKSAVVAKIGKLKKNKELKRTWHFDEFDEGYLSALDDIEKFFNTLEIKEIDIANIDSAVDSISDSLHEEPVSDDLEEACQQLAKKARIRKTKTISPFFSQTDYIQGVRDGAEWIDKTIIDIINIK